MFEKLSKVKKLVNDINQSKIEFLVGSPVALDENIGDYDYVVVVGRGIWDELQKREVCFPRYEDPIEKSKIRELVGDSPVILEIGCHSGADSREFLQHIPEASLYCFEADPRPIAAFKMQSLYFDPRCKFFEFAISDEDGEAEWFMSGPGRGRDWDFSSSLCRPTGHLERWPDIKFDRRIIVKTQKLDTWLDDHPEIDVIDFIWADVQGSERMLIKGAQEALRRTRFLYTEYYEKPMYEGQPSLDEILFLLKTYKCVGVWEDNALLENQDVQG
jgi:FkbM family methyltransferase